MIRSHVIKAILNWMIAVMKFKKRISTLNFFRLTVVKDFGSFLELPVHFHYSYAACFFPVTAGVNHLMTWLNVHQNVWKTILNYSVFCAYCSFSLGWLLFFALSVWFLFSIGLPQSYWLCHGSFTWRFCGIGGPINEINLSAKPHRMKRLRSGY